MHSRYLYLLVVMVGVRCDEYLDEVEGRCQATHRQLSCAKYKIFKTIDEFQFDNIGLNSDSSVQLVHYPGDNSSEVGLFAESRQYSSGDSEVSKIFKFFKRQVVKVLGETGLTFELPEGARVIEDTGREGGFGGGTRNKRKKSMMLSMLMLIKLFKIKVLAALILAGVVFIKKSILIAAFLFPGIIASIKHHCKQYHVVPYHHAEDEHYHHEHEQNIGDSYGLTGYGGAEKHHYYDRSKRKYSYY